MRLGRVAGLTLGLLACEQGTQPKRDVAALALSRNDVVLEIGDTVLLRAEARDIDGKPIEAVPITWDVLDPGIVDLSMTSVSTRVSARSAGTARIVARSGATADTAVIRVLALLTSTTLSLHRDTLPALADTIVVRVGSQDPDGPRLGIYTVTGRNPAVAQVTFAVPDLTITSLSPGSTYVTVVERHGTRDSVLVVVQQREAMTELTPPVAGGYVGRTQQLTAVVKDRRGNLIPGVSITFHSLDTTIATVSSTGLLTFLRGGTGAVEARGAGGTADTSVVAVPQEAHLVLRVAAESIGTGLMGEAQWIGVDANGGLTPWAQLTIVNPAIAQAPESVLTASSGGTFRIIGKQAGATKLIASSPGMLPDTMTVFVSKSHLDVRDADLPEQFPRALPIGTQGRVGVATRDSLGRLGDVAGQVYVTVTSRNTTVVTVSPAGQPYLLPPSTQGSVLTYVDPVDTGRAWIVATATGFPAESTLYIVKSLPKLVFRKGRQLTIGGGQRNIDGASIGTTKGWDHGGAVPITFAHGHAAVSTFPDTMTLPANALYWPLNYIGVTPGVDTIVASAAGYESDTTILYVTTPHFLRVEAAVRGTILGGYASFYVADSLGNRQATDSALLVVATPADTTIARAATTRIPAQWSTSWTVGIPTVDTGTTTITLTDSAGRYASTTYTLRVILDSSFRMAVYDGYELGPPSPRMRFDETRFTLYIPVSPAPGRVVHLTATNPRVLRVPDSLVVQGYSYTRVPIVAGDTFGTSRIIVSAPLFKSDTSVPILVTAGQLHLVAPATAFTRAAYTVQAAGWRGQYGCNLFMPFDSAATLTLLPLDSGVVVDNAVTVPAGNVCSAPVPIRFTAPGNQRLALVDRRAVPAPYAGDTVTIRVRRPRLTFQYPYAPTVGVGQRLLFPIVRDGVGQDTANGALTHSSSHSSSPASFQLIPGAFQWPPWFDGVSTGPDTVIVSAPGYDGDTLPLMVTEGKVAVYHWPTQIKVGDSVVIALMVEDSTGLQHPVIDTTTFSIVKQGGVAFHQAFQSISAVTLLPGQNASGTFFLKAVGPAGTATVRFENLYYGDQIFTVSITP